MQFKVGDKVRIYEVPTHRFGMSEEDWIRLIAMGTMTVVYSGDRCVRLHEDLCGFYIPISSVHMVCSNGQLEFNF